MKDNILNTEKIEGLCSNILSTLDEPTFFSYLDKFFLERNNNVTKSNVFLILDDKSMRLVSENGKAVNSDKLSLKKDDLLAGHVIKTKCAYVSNNVDRDPLCVSGVGSNVKSVLCIPIMQDGVILATMHLHSNVSNNFGADDITDVVSVLNKLKRPLSNMKVYLSARTMNRSLSKRLSDIEEELQIRSSTGSVINPYKVEEKEVIVKSKAMQRVLQIADKTAQSSVSGFIFGEKGTGREMLAKRIHCRSDRRDKGFAAIDCSVFTDSELEVELFGREQDIATGTGGRTGIIDTIDGGTLFLDNIESIGPRLQYKLNIAISDGIIFKVNSSVPSKTEICIFASTTVDIQNRVKDNTFNNDLFCSLNRMNIKMASLREREEDIEALAFHFLNRNRTGDRQKSFSPRATKALLKYTWPGNVRELQSVIERAYIISEGPIVEEKDLADFVLNYVARDGSDASKKNEPFVNMTLHDLEKKHICKTLESLGGNKTKTAKSLGITVKTLYNKLHSYGMVTNQVG